MENAYKTALSINMQVDMYTKRGFIDIRGEWKVKAFKSPCCKVNYNEIDCSSCDGYGYQSKEDEKNDIVCGDCQGDGVLECDYECSKCGEHFYESDLVEGGE